MAGHNSSGQDDSDCRTSRAAMAIDGPSVPTAADEPLVPGSPLDAAGRVIPARSHGPAPRPIAPMHTGAEDAGTLLARLRAEERH